MLRRKHSPTVKELQEKLRAVEEQLQETKAQLNIKEEAWRVLYSIFGERMQQDELDLMDGVLKGMIFDIEDRTEQFEVGVLRQFPGLATEEADNEELP